ncbi:MAG TPA: regulatory signaling modulator protein AmpE [Kineobactrum sp.]
MNFLAFIIAFAARQLWGSQEWLHRDGWWLDWQRRAAGFGLGPWLQLLLTVGLPTFLAALVLDLLQPLLFGLLWIAAAVLLLLYAFGRGDFHALVARYRDYCERGNGEGAWLFATEELGVEAAKDNDPERPLFDLHQQVQVSLLYDGFQRWFAVVFFFFLLGPAAALAYRLLQLYRETNPVGPVLRLLFVLDWLPARVLAATFVLAGDFVRSRDALVAMLGDMQADAGQLLQAVGIAAAAPGERDAPLAQAAENADALSGLLRRSGIAWVLALAVVAILG